MWASVARGDVGVGAGASTCPKQQPAVPAVTAADFTALFDSCLAGGLKARLVFSAVAGGQTLTLSCHLPVPASTTAVAGKRRRRRHRRRRKRGRAAISAPEDQARVSPPIRSNPTAPTLPQAPPLFPSLEIASPPAKKIRKRRNELELLRDYDGEDELLLSPSSQTSHAGIISEFTHDLRNAAIAHSACNPACAAHVPGYAATAGGGGFRLASPGNAGNTHCPYNACTAHATCLATRRGATCSLHCAFDAAAAICAFDTAAATCGADICGPTISTSTESAASRRMDFVSYLS